MNTEGLCPCCGSVRKLRNGLLVHHGYKRPGDGRTHGACYGVGMAPHEAGPMTAVAYLGHLLNRLEQEKARVKGLLEEVA